MPTITLSSFQGENRALEAKLLPDGQGVASRNQKPGRGDLRGWREPLQVFSAPAGTETIYRMGRDTPSDTDYWLAWQDVVHAARGFDVEDTTERTAYTGDGYPKVTDNLALSPSNPTVNPVAHRPLGIPAPATAPAVSVNQAAADPDTGKYRVLFSASAIAALRGGETYRITVGGGTPQEFTLPGTSSTAVTPQQLAATLDALGGVHATATASDDEDTPLGVKCISDAVGAAFQIERLTGTSSSYGEGDVTLQTLWSAAADGSGNGGAAQSTLVRVTATTAVGFEVLLPDAKLETLSAQDQLVALVSGGQRFAANITGNSRAAVVAALAQVGASGVAQDAVPFSNGGEFGEYNPGQEGGVRVNVGTTSTGNVVELARRPKPAASLVIAQSWLTANAASGDRWQVQVGSAPAVSVTLVEGANTYPKTVTVETLQSSLRNVAGVTLAVESDGGLPQLRLTANSSITIKKIVPGATRSWSLAAAAAVISPAVRNVDTYFYVYTYVTDWGWESAPSPVSSSIERTVKETCTLSGIAAPPAGGYEVNRIRLYRTQAGSTGDADFFFLLEAPRTSATLTDDGRSLGEVLPTKTWLPAPGVPRGGADNHTEPNLTWLTAMWNGMLAGIVGKSVRMCEAYTPYAWPIAYDAVPPDQPVALGVFGQTLLVLTTGRPFLMTGSSPESMDESPLDIPQGCIAPRSAVSMGNGVAWASNDGLCWYGEGGARILTAGVMTREDWLALRPETIRGQMYEGLYFGSYEPVPGQPRQGFLVSPAGGGVFFLDEGFDAAYFDKLQDQLYLLRDTDILKWEAGAEVMSATFRSKVYRQARPLNFACAEVVATGYPVQVSVWADGVLRHQRAVADREPFRLPGGFLAMDWQVQVETPPVDGGVQAVLLAQSMRELAQL